MRPLIVMLVMVTSLSAQEKFHVFPQVADGHFSDGSYYRTTLMITTWFDSDAPFCAYRLYGMTATFENTGVSSGLNLTFTPGGFYAGRTTGTQAFQSGYATLTCDDYVFAQLLYSFYSSNGTKISEATVFSSPESFNQNSSRIIGKVLGSGLRSRTIQTLRKATR